MKVRILGHDYKVKRPYEQLADTHEWGRVNTRTQEILIDGSTKGATADVTLMHEILEVVDELLDLKLDHQKLQAIAAAIYCVLVDNPGLFRKGEKRWNIFN